jgi:hypothetical protein
MSTSGTGPLPAKQDPAIDSPEADAPGPATAPPATPPTVAPTGKRQAFRDIRRQLQETELANPGVQRLLLEDLERAEGQCDILQGYVTRYHEADKRSAILEEKLRTQTAIEIFFGVGLGVGCMMLGLVPSIWDATFKGPVFLITGIMLVVGAVGARVIKR